MAPRPPNKGMKLTKLSPAPLPNCSHGKYGGAGSCPRRTISDAGTASQLIPGVRQTSRGVIGDCGVAMRALGRAVAISVAALSLVGAGSTGTVQIYADGKLRGAFEPRGEPYASDGPSVLLYLEKQDVKTADGQVVTGFEFIGWPAGQGIRVQVLLLVPAKGEADSFLPEGRAERLAHRYFTSVLLAKGDEVVLSKMQKLGVTPMKLRLR